MSEFRGWPPEALDFLRALEANNDSDWFKARRGEYDRHLAEPTKALGRDLSALGRPKTFRPFNDQRFHARPPLKEHIGLAVGYEGAGGFYVELSLDGLLVACGLHNPAPDQVARMRLAIDDGRRSGALTKAIARATDAGLQLSEPDLVRIPRGFDPDHPRAELLRRKRLVATRRHPTARWMSQPQAGRRIRELLDAGQPLVEWLRTHVGPSERAPRAR